jgi:arylsulfatase A-like enzyme
MLVLAGLGYGLSVATDSATIRTAAGVALGRLPSGVRRSDLNLLVITLDTTRADRLGAYGFPGVETPSLDRVAREGVRFDHMTSAAPLTLPAHCSLFTGRLPPQHGVRQNGMALRADEVTLAMVLKSQGFQTAAVPAAFVVSSQWGLNQGFEQYIDGFGNHSADEPEDAPRGPHAARALRRSADDVADRALDWLQEHDRGRFFTWLHFYDPHAPYEPPEPYRSRYAKDPYLGEIAFMDEQLGRVFGYLEARRLLNRTIIVVVGDHGESLGEHGEHTHGLFVYESVLRVPFIIRAPFTNLRGRRVDEPTRSIDMMPTVLDLLGISAPAGVQGRSLAGLMTGTERALELETYSESMYPRDFGWSDLRASRIGRFKVIVAPRPELYDLAVDPHELSNLYTKRRALAEHMAARVRAMGPVFEIDSQIRDHHIPASDGRSVPGSRVSESEDRAARARLASLGYIGPSRDVAAADESALSDPKDQIDLYNLITGARAIANAGRSPVPPPLLMPTRTLP